MCADYEKFAADLPKHRTVSFESVDENEEALKRAGVTQEMRQLGKGQYRADLAMLSTAHADFFSDRFNKAFSMYLGPPAETVGLLFLRTTHGQFTVCGETVANDKLIVIPDGIAIDLTGPDLCGSDSITLSKKRFAELTEVLCPTTPVATDRITAIEGNPAQLNALRGSIVEVINESPSVPRSDEIPNVVARTIAWLGDPASVSRLEGFNCRTERQRVAKLAQSHLEEYYRETIRLEDLCRLTGFGVRAVQRSFKSYFGITISEYLKVMRLDAARRDLIAAHPTAETVTAIAMRHGNKHLGRFSVEFRHRFGQSPKETLESRRTVA